MITKTKRFGMRLSPQDREIFAYLAAQLQRTESDALRVVAREKVASMKGEATTPASVEAQDADQAK